MFLNYIHLRFANQINWSTTCVMGDTFKWFGSMINIRLNIMRCYVYANRIFYNMHFQHEYFLRIKIHFKHEYFLRKTKFIANEMFQMTNKLWPDYQWWSISWPMIKSPWIAWKWKYDLAIPNLPKQQRAYSLIELKLTQQTPSFDETNFCHTIYVTHSFKNFKTWCSKGAADHVFTNKRVIGIIKVFNTIELVILCYSIFNA